MIPRIIGLILIMICLFAPAYADDATAELTAAQCVKFTPGNSWTFNVDSNIFPYIMSELPDNPQASITFQELSEDGKATAIEDSNYTKVKIKSYYRIDKSGNLLIEKGDYPFSWAYYFFWTGDTKKARIVTLPEKPFVYAVLPASVIPGIEWKQNIQFVIPYGTFVGKKATVTVRNKIREMNRTFTVAAGTFTDVIIIDTFESMTIEGTGYEFQEQSTVLYSPMVGMPIKIILAMVVPEFRPLSWKQELYSYSLK